MQELWKDILGLNGLYQVSNKGQVRRLLKSGQYHTTFGATVNKGYKIVVFMKNGVKFKRAFVHRLVAETFVRPLKENEIVHHINHIRTDNRLQNLQIMTKEEHDRDLVKIQNKIYATQHVRRKLRRMTRIINTNDNGLSDVREKIF